MAAEPQRHVTEPATLTTFGGGKSLQPTLTITLSLGLVGNLLLGGAAVVAVIFLMMGWRSALIVTSALPLSAFMVLAGLRLLEIPIHQMSITGLIIALGLLIDNAIVIVDEVTHQLSEGRGRREAVSNSVRKAKHP